MPLFGIWTDFGFRDNPYSQDTLAGDDTGDQLLVGRDQLVSDIQRRIGSGGAHPTVEGPVGVGKTSLLNVAAYRMERQCLEAQAGELYLLASRRFQPGGGVDDLEAEVYRVVAQTLIRAKGSFKAVGLTEPDLDEIEQWLNSSEYKSKSGGASAFGFGLEGGAGSEPNTGDGYTRGGFPAAVRDALEVAFPPGTGGVICILDNLEIVETAGVARARLDELRDRIFNVPQLRWVLCGSRGIVSRARTERLSGIFHAPLKVGPLDDVSAISAIRKRIDIYGVHDAQAPVTPIGFEHIYQSLNKNLRDAMSTAQEFAHWLSDGYVAKGSPVPEDTERDQLLEAWLADRAEDAFKDARDIQKRQWQFFEELCNHGGRAGSAEFEEFGFGQQQQMTSAVTALSNANLLVREIDPDNGSRTVNAVTALGWLVNYHRANYAMPPSRALP